LDGKQSNYDFTVSPTNFLDFRAQKSSHFLSNDGYGIGDDAFSVSFDGCRKLIWHNAKSMPIKLPTWKSGSVCGCFIDVDTKKIMFSLDGVEANVELKDVFADLR
jgi:RING finger and SPRY domain-containing protein 1